MLIAKQLKQTNIAEYLLYMWQVEDLLRAFRCDIDLIDQRIVSTYQTDDATRREIHDWYESLIDMMNAEGVREKGHIQLVKNTLMELEELHTYLLHTGCDTGYNAKFYHVLPSVVFLKSKSTDPSISDLEMCFVFLYGIMQLQRLHKELTDETSRMKQEITKLLSLLAGHYIKRKEGKEDE